MKFTLAVLLFGSPLAIASSTTPISKVVQLISDLQAKVISEGESAQKIYAEYSEWCEDRARDLGHEIKTGKAQVETLKATIAQEESTAESLNAKIEEVAASISTDEADHKAATGIRSSEESAFKAEEAELSETVDMLQRAVTLVEREMSKTSGSFLQAKAAGGLTDAIATLVQASSMSSADASKLTSMLQEAQKEDSEDYDAELGAPAADVYTSKSGNIVDTLQGLLEKAEAQLADTRKKETQNVHNYEMLKQSIEDELKFAKKDMDESKKSLAASAELKSNAEGDLGSTSKELAADESTKSDLHHSCMTKAEDFEAETKSRAEELKALAEAKKVIQENTGGAESLSYGSAAFLQLASKLRSGTDLANYEAVRFVRDLARKRNAPELAQLAQRMSSAMRLGGATADPFAKVKGLVQDMIEKLEADRDADASKKEYCDKELSETSEKKADKSSEIAKLSTKIDQASGKSAQLKEEAAEVQASLAKLIAAQADMDKMRKEEHDAFTKNKADTEQGLSGVKMALKILSEYYAAGDKAHSAAQGAGSSIIGLLEVVESDFSKGLAEITATEETAAAAYEQETKDNAVEKVTKEQDLKYLTKQSVSLDKTVSELSSDRSGVQAELDAVLEYLAKIEEQCIAKAETYASRKERREAEIAGLKEALTILESETALIQSSSRTAQRPSRSLRGLRSNRVARRHVGA